MAADLERKATQTCAAEVVEELPQLKWRLRMVDQREILAHAAPASQVNFVRLRPGDRVEVEISPHDKGRGRIVKLLTR
jgi:translation initiation factor IF-1